MGPPETTIMEHPACTDCVFDTAVHQSCYGVRGDLPDSWLCHPCAAKVADVRCVLCPVRIGAFKPTTEGEWAHIVCANWLPETWCGDNTKVEPVCGIEDVDADRCTWSLLCVVCRTREGACLQCTSSCGRCVTAFHASCALAPDSGISLEMEERGDFVHKIARCEKHC